jgi:hypothetical protein
MSRAELDDERAFLLRSIEDLDREWAAGDLSARDHADLRDRYVARAAQVLRALDDNPHHADNADNADGDASPEAAGPEASLTARPNGRRRALLVSGVVAVVVAVAGVVVVTQAASRLPGDTSSGTVTVSRAEQLRRTVAQAETLQARGDAAGAVRLYRQVLAQNGTQADALAQLGWLEYEAGVQSRNGAVLQHAQQLEEQAVRVDGGAYAPHLYLGSMLLAEHDDVGAQRQYRLFLGDHPPVAQVRVAAPFIERAFAANGQAPPALPGVTATPGR